MLSPRAVAAGSLTNPTGERSESETPASNQTREGSADNTVLFPNTSPTDPPAPRVA